MARITNPGLSKPRPYGVNRPCTSAPIGSGPEGPGSDIKAKWAACCCWENTEAAQAADKERA